MGLGKTIMALSLTLGVSYKSIRLLEKSVL